MLTVRCLLHRERRGQAIGGKVDKCIGRERPIYKERVKWMQSVPGHVTDTNCLKYLVKYPSLIGRYYVIVNSIHT